MSPEPSPQLVSVNPGEPSSSGHSDSSHKDSKFQLLFTWYMCWVTRTTGRAPTNKRSVVAIWLAIIAGRDEEGDIWFWQGEDEESLRTVFPSFADKAPVLSDTEWANALQALAERQNKKCSPPSFSHLTFGDRVRLIQWFIVAAAGPNRHAHLQSGDCVFSIVPLIKLWGAALCGTDFVSSGDTPLCNSCQVSQWLDVWISMMRKIHSWDDLLSIPWRWRCQCLETKLNVSIIVARPQSYTEYGRNSVMSRVLDSLVVSPWPLILWLMFRLMGPTPLASFQIFLDILRKETGTAVFSWDDLDDSWLLDRFSRNAAAQSGTNGWPHAWFNVLPNLWRQYLIELDPTQWRLIHDITWHESLHDSSSNHTTNVTFRLAAVFHTYPSTRPVMTDILESLGFHSHKSFFDAIARADPIAMGEVQRPRLLSSEDNWLVPALREWIQEWEQQLFLVAWHGTPDTSILDRYECVSLVYRVKIPQNLVVYTFPLMLRRSERRLNQFRDLVRRCEDWDILTSIANYRSAAETLLGLLKNSPVSVSDTSHNFASKIHTLLSHDIATIFAKLTLFLRQPKGYKSFLACRGTITQQLLDLLQELLDYRIFLPVRPLLFKALERLSRASGLHPTCFKLEGLQKLGRQVAAGAFGDVWKSSVRGQTVSIKVMRLFEEGDVRTLLKEFGREALVWRQISHPNLLPFLGMYYLDERLCLVSPWMENGNILQFMTKNPSQIEHRSLILDIARGVEYLHSEQVVHGDLKGMNILVTPAGNACIADFGLSSVVDAMTQKFSHSSITLPKGTTRWQAPELLRGVRSNHFGSDIYAFSCVCYEIMTQKAPFYELAEPAIPFKVVSEGFRPTRPEHWPTKTAKHSDAIWQLMEDCWHENPDVRPQASSVVQRLGGPLIEAELKASTAAWDEKFTSKFRRSLQARPLLPSITQIEGMIFGDDMAEACTECKKERTAEMGSETDVKESEGKLKRLAKVFEEDPEEEEEDRRKRRRRSQAPPPETSMFTL